MRHLFAASLVAIWLLFFVTSTASAQGLLPQTPYRLKVLDRAGRSVTELTDGDQVRLTVEVATSATAARTFNLYLEGETALLGACTIPGGGQQCTTGLVETLGWFWDRDEQVRPRRTLYATLNNQRVAVVATRIKPRPAVLVHGFGADFHTWDKYLGPAGYLARVGVPGYAVGDGQVPGAMNTGRLFRPGQATNTIAQNAAVLKEYIAGVKAETGAQQVDLIVHSMGGLISRYYIARLMEERDVAQLIMLGTPNGGSDCALLTGGLSLYLPAALELRTDYVRNVFNPQITDQRGIPFYTFAGTPIQRRILSPCTGTPNDLVVSLESAATFTNELEEVPILHTDLNTSEELFTDHVAPLLRQPGRELATRAAQVAAAEPSTAVQFSMVYTGTVTTRAGDEQIIHIDREVAVASFGIYDPSRSVTVTVRGVAGNVITLTPDTHGLTVLDDPETLHYLGYGLDNPRPGPWRVTVQPTLRTPPLGTTYAIVVQYVGGATIRAALSSHLVGINQDVTLTAGLQLGDDPLPIDEAILVLHYPDGTTSRIPPGNFRNGVQVSWQVEQPGIYGLDVTLRSTLADGIVVERATYLALQAFERPPALNQ